MLKHFILLPDAIKKDLPKVCEYTFIFDGHHGLGSVLHKVRG